MKPLPRIEGEVQRYQLGPDGDEWVKADDYAALNDYAALVQMERDMARAEVERLTHDVERHQRIATEHIAEAERLTGILQAHNDECDRACREDRDPLRCDAYLSRGRTCPDCPMDEKINFRLPDPTTGQ